MKLSWQQGPLSPGAIGRFLVPELMGLTSWYTVRAGDKSAAQGAWQHTDLPSCASELQGRVAFAWPAMEAFYEEDERIMGHAADIDDARLAVYLDGVRLHLEPGQTLIPHGLDGDLDVAETLRLVNA